MLTLPNGHTFRVNGQHRPRWFARLLVIGLITLSPGPVLAQTARQPGLQGFCPVTLLDAGRVEKGHAGLSRRFDGVEYRFTSRAARRAFDAHPLRYVPVLNGDCVVCYDRAHIRVAGHIKFASVHNGRLYLFPAQQWKQAFEANPGRYENVDLAVGGDSIVWLTERGRSVAGQPELTEVDNGYRYQFASQLDRRSFLQRKRKYVTAARLRGRVLMASDDAVGNPPRLPAPTVLN